MINAGEPRLRRPTMRQPPRGAEADEMATRRLRTWRFWDRVEDRCRRYVFLQNPSERFRCFREREGKWVLLRFIILLIVGTLLPAAFDHVVVLSIAILVSSVLAFDILFFNTAVVFVTARPLNLLRSNVFTVFGYVSLAVAFAPLWLWLHVARGPATNRAVDAIYQSVRTLTTAGPEGELCVGAKLLATSESLIGIYFLSIIVAGYLSLQKGGRTA
jgi:hypothetical protein